MNEPISKEEYEKIITSAPSDMELPIYIGKHDDELLYLDLVEAKSIAMYGTTGISAVCNTSLFSMLKAREQILRQKYFLCVSCMGGGYSWSFNDIPFADEYITDSCTGVFDLLHYYNDVKRTLKKLSKITDDEFKDSYYIFQMCGDGYTAKGIYQYLQEKQIRRPNGKEIAYNSGLYLLSNRIYIGEYRHSGIMLEHGVPAIITEELFEKVQDNIKKHSIAPAAHSENDDYLLTTHLFCGHCGAMMTAYSGTSRTGKTYRYYICNRARKHLCEKEKVEKEKIENFVVYKTMELLQEDETIERLAQLLYTLQYEESTILPHLEEQLKEKEREIENIVTAIQKGAASDTLIARLTEIEQQKKALAEAITEEKKKSPVFTKDEFKMALCNFRKIDIGKLEGRRKLIDMFVNSVFLYDDHLKIIYNGKEKEETISLEELESSKIS